MWKKNPKKTLQKHKLSVRDHCHFTSKYRGAAHGNCNLKLNVPNQIPVVFHNRSNYDYHFIIKELPNEFEGKFECYRKIQISTKNVPLQWKKKVAKIDKDGNEGAFKIKFIDSARFMATSLTNLVDNLTEGIQKIKCKDCNCFLNMKVSTTI